MAAVDADRRPVRPLLRLAAVDFLNPAPLMWNFEHPPLAAELAERYSMERMSPADCATALGAGEADLGLIPVGAYAALDGLAVVPGCAIASLGAIRSLLLVYREGADEGAEEFPQDEPDLAGPTAAALRQIRTVALDTSSRTTALYTQVLFRRFWGHAPRFVPHAPELERMLEGADAAVLIGDPALVALRDRAARLARTGERLRYLDLGYAWRQATGTPWVSAVWAVREAGVAQLSRAERAAVVDDLERSRDAGLRHLPELVREWAPQLGLRPATVEHYLTKNIYYYLDAPVIAGVERFFAEAHALGLVPSLPGLRWFGA